MRYYISLMALFVIGISLLAACNQSPAGNATTTTATKPANNTAAPAATKDPADSAPRISLADAKKAFDQGNIVVIDTRPAAQFQPDHIKGAINITVEELEAKYKSIPTGKKIIAYCSWPAEHTSAGLVAKLNEKGIENAFALVGGTQAWKDAKFPMEGETNSNSNTAKPK